MQKVLKLLNTAFGSGAFSTS